MRDEHLARDLYAQCSAELKQLDAISKELRDYGKDAFLKNSETLYNYRTKVLLIMERLANGERPPEGKNVLGTRERGVRTYREPPAQSV